MVNISIVSAAQANEDFCTVTLRQGKCPACFNEGTAFIPDNGGFAALQDPTDKNAFQKAGRSAGAAGLSKVVLKQEEVFNLTALGAVQFIAGMYSETAARKGMSVAFDLSEAELKSVRRDIKFITLGRIFSDSANNLYHTVDLVNTLYRELETAVKEFAPETDISFRLYKKGDKLFDKECIGLQAVGNSSFYEPCLGVIDIVGKSADREKTDIVLVGKGIAFDTGGNNIKTGKYMDTMRTDKTGLVTVAAASCLAAAMGADLHIRCYMPCAENKLSGKAPVPGDILTYPNGVSVEIANTDAEGRLILADALILAGKDRPKFILDAATLTGAAKIAVGRDCCAMLCRENRPDPQLERAYEYTGEEFWMLPLKEYHKRYITASRADIANSGMIEGGPGASTAAAFLSYFVPSDIKWTHLDLSNAYMTGGSALYAVGSTGANILSLAHWLTGCSY